MKRILALAAVLMLPGCVEYAGQPGYIAPGYNGRPLMHESAWENRERERRREMEFSRERQRAHEVEGMRDRRRIEETHSRPAPRPQQRPLTDRERRDMHRGLLDPR